MVKTGARAEVLSRMLTRLGHRRSATSPRPPRLDSVSPDLVPELMDVYRLLGGPLDAVTFRPGSWDLSFDDGLLVELDEELHFNRYRRLTLTAEWAEPLAWRADFLDLCTRREADCLKAATWGKRWTNPSCEAMFGVVGEPGVLDGPGAPRWKQRAMYDSIKDAWSISGNEQRLVRISTHDVIGGVAVGDALQGKADLNLDGLRVLVQQRATSA